MINTDLQTLIKMHVKISRIATKKEQFIISILAKVNNDSLLMIKQNFSTSNNQILVPAYIRIHYSLEWGWCALSFILGSSSPLGSGVLSSELVHVKEGEFYGPDLKMKHVTFIHTLFTRTRRCKNREHCYQRTLVAASCIHTPSSWGGNQSKRMQNKISKVNKENMGRAEDKILEITTHTSNCNYLHMDQ